jgi:hypothetical protein
LRRLSVLLSYSNVDDKLEGYKIKSALLFKIFSTLLISELEKFMRTLTRDFVRMLSKQMMRLKARNSELCFWKTGEILNLKTRMRNPSKKCQISCPKGSKNEGVLNKMRMLQVRCISIKVQIF